MKSFSSVAHSSWCASATNALMTWRVNQWCGLRPSVLGQDRSQSKKNRSWSWSCKLWSWSWSCRSGVVLWNTVLLRSSS